MNDWSRYLLTLPELRAAVKRHGWKGACVAGGLFLSIALLTFCLPRQYVSEAKLFVRIGHESLTLDPTVTTNQTVSIYETRDSEINSLLEVLRSREVLEGLVDLLGTNAILHQGAIPDLQPSNAAPLATEQRKYDAKREQALLRLEQMLAVGSPKRTNIITLHCKAESPQLAQATLNALLIVYRNIHAEVNSTPASHRFFEEQEKLLQERWQTAAAELRQTKDRKQMVTLEGKRTMLQDQLTDAERQLHTLQIDSAASQARIAELQTKLKEIPPFRAIVRSETNNVSDGIRAVLFQLEAKEQELASKYTAAHPLVIAVQEQIAALREVHRNEGSLRSQDTKSINPASEHTEFALLDELSQQQANATRLKLLTQQRENLLADLQKLHRDEIGLAELQQTVELAAQAHRETAVRLEQARIQRDLTSERISNLNVIQPATFVSKAVAPKRTLLLALGAFVSALFGMATVLALAYRKRHFATWQEVVASLHLPLITPTPIPTFARQPILAGR